MRSTLNCAIRVIIVDSSVMHCELLSEDIARHPRFQVVAATADFAQVHNIVSGSSADILLFNPGSAENSRAGLDLLARLRRSHPRLSHQTDPRPKVIMLLESPKRELVVEAFRLGARGIFSGSSPLSSLSKCIICVQEGQIWASSEELGFVLDALAIAPSIRPGDSVGLNQLSARELQVVNCLAEGLTNQEIAQRLKLSRHTVKNYMFRIFDKLGVSNRVELLSYAMSLQDDSGGNGIAKPMPPVAEPYSSKREPLVKPGSRETIQ